MLYCFTCCSSLSNELSKDIECNDGVNWIAVPISETLYLVNDIFSSTKERRLDSTNELQISSKTLVVEKEEFLIINSRMRS